MSYKSDIEIAQSCEMRPIGEIAKKAHVDEKYVENIRASQWREKSFKRYSSKYLG